MACLSSVMLFNLPFFQTSSCDKSRKNSINTHRKDALIIEEVEDR
jgi:hypothetical protein